MMSVKNYNDSEKRNPEASKILDQSPSWIVRWGVTILFSIFLTLIFSTSMVRYRGSIREEILLTTHNSITKVFAEDSGRIIRLLKKSGAPVRKGERLATIERIVDSKNISSNNHYTILSPDSGVMYFLRPLAFNLPTSTNLPLFAIIQKKEPLTGLVTMRSKVIHNINMEQTVMITVDQYPSDVYGKLVGTVKAISNISNDYCSVEIELRNGLVTQLNKELSYCPEMSGEVEFLTADTSLLDRIVDRISSLLNR